ncbi:cell division protein FtsQ/DivIB [Pelodictyon luteolum]|uniref:FtsQ protein, putative n=1 Tax=Chlorobium luteolum (strain DSM 273 / BCRC 81028 / 2530) TaxID=319225 RepID=Q3B132_CHLL3|nr:FtsQ-type POTRA domain-containing protein [Pelodictyon luteolum]ABB24949.1 FtsQ protein, putative [Pelodictyon luteolum DSM 273]
MTDSEESSASRPLERPDRAPRSGGGGKAFILAFLPVLLLLGWLWKSALSWKEDVRVRSIVVEGAEIVAPYDVESALASHLGRPMDGVDTVAAAERVNAIAWVKDAAVNRELNGILRVTLRERRPMALSIVDGVPSAIDRDGVLMPRTMLRGARFRELLTVSGIGRTRPLRYGFRQIEGHECRVVRKFVDALADAPYAGLLVRSLHVDGEGLTYFTVAGDPARFIIGNDGDFKEKLEKFEIFWRKVVSKKGFGTYETVDLRFRDRIFTTDAPAREAPPEAPQ